jgi:copper homeostasis protein
VVAVEIAVQSPEGARLARDQGADRVELCAALGVGGLTPSAAAVARAARVGLPVHVLIRPRPGGFVYTPAELELQADDIAWAVAHGAAGVVVGALTPERTVDRAGLARLVTAADGHPVTFHRAFDVTADPGAALDDLVTLGVTRVLTSGQAATAAAGRALLARLVERAAGRIEIQAGGGVRPADIPALVAAGVDAVHLSARAERADAGPAGPGGAAADAYDVTDPALVAAAVAAAGTRPAA